MHFGSKTDQFVEQHNEYNNEMKKKKRKIAKKNWKYNGRNAKPTVDVVFFLFHVNECRTRLQACVQL